MMKKLSLRMRLTLLSALVMARVLYSCFQV